MQLFFLCLNDELVQEKIEDTKQCSS